MSGLFRPRREKVPAFGYMAVLLAEIHRELHAIEDEPKNLKEGKQRLQEWKQKCMKI